MQYSGRHFTIPDNYNQKEFLTAAVATVRNGLMLEKPSPGYAGYLCKVKPDRLSEIPALKLEIINALAAYEEMFSEDNFGNKITENQETCK